MYIFILESDTNETHKLRQDLDEVRMSILNLECDTNRKNEEITIDLNEWQIHKAKLEEIRPWLENAERKINTDHIKPITLKLANDWLKNAEVSIDKKQTKIKLNFQYSYELLIMLNLIIKNKIKIPIKK